MSRARRGGNGGRGGRGPAGTHRIAGVDIPVDNELVQGAQRPQPAPLFPVSQIAAATTANKWPALSTDTMARQ